MSSPRIVAIWLDGFEMSLADDWALPALARLTSDSACAQLDNGTAHLTGLSGEHLVTGLDPSAAGRASALYFDPATYTCVQRGAGHAPAIGGVPSVVFDPCYFDFDRAGPNVQGLTDWGAHDPGGPPQARPAGLHAEVKERFGAYPAGQWTYGTPWASPADCERMGIDLAESVERRAEIASWLLGERFVDWQFALLGVSEAHSATEGLFHGVDSSHLLHSSPSGPVAAQALRSVYEAIDGLVDRLVNRFPDDLHVIFSLHGMGANSSDVPSMVLLGELMSRWSGKETPDLRFPTNDDGVPLLAPGESWARTMNKALRPPTPQERPRRSPARRLARRARRIVSWAPASPIADGTPDWMPVVRHQACWPTMRAFAIPSFYDGRVRVNVRGREARGLVDADEYNTVLDEIEGLLRECREPRTGGSVVQSFHRPSTDPALVSPTDADLVIEWADSVLGFVHPRLGQIGPIPPRRTGGHTSPVGRIMVHGPGVTSSDLGTRSSFDVLPTLLALAHSPTPWQLSGRPIEIAAT